MKIIFHWLSNIFVAIVLLMFMDRCVVYHKHFDDISYYHVGKTPNAEISPENKAPFTVYGNHFTKEIKNVPIYVKILGHGRLDVGYTLQGKKYLSRLDTNEVLSNPCFSIKISSKQETDSLGNPNIYCFKF